MTQKKSVSSKIRQYKVYGVKWNLEKSTNVKAKISLNKTVGRFQLGFDGEIMKNM